MVYCQEIAEGQTTALHEEEAHHLTRVLRKSPGDEIHICDGFGNLYLGRIVSVIKKQTNVQAMALLKSLKEPESRLTIAITPTKNISRFEWFVEKSTEIGITGIIPMLTEHSERKNIKPHRIEKIIISAMKQSGHLFKPLLYPLTELKEMLQKESENRFIAYSEDLPPVHLIRKADPGKSTIILIGPEGDFSPLEFSQATSAGFIPVNLGNSRLRTETAGVAAAQIFESKKFAAL